MKTTVKVMKLHENAVIPTKSYEFDSGFDLCAVETTIIPPGETVIVKTGLAFEIPDGYELQVRPRSGVSSRTKLLVIFGTVDSQYRGEVGMIVHNASRQSGLGIAINEGDRIAQAVFQEVPQIVLSEWDELTQSKRGTNGFGSTGVS